MLELTDSAQERQRHIDQASRLLAEGKAIGALIEIWRANRITPDRPRLRAAAQEAKIVSKLRLLVTSTARGEAVNLSVQNLLPLDRDERLALLEAVFDAADRVRTIRPDRADNAWRAEAAAIGLDADALSRFLLGWSGKPNFYTYSLDHPQLPFQRELIRQGSFETESPFSGERIASSRSFLVLEETSEGPRPHLFYHFQDREPFFAVVNPYTGDATGLYFPLGNVLIDAQKKIYPNAVGLLKALISEFATESINYINSDISPDVGLLYGSMYHLGHSTYEYEACHRCLSSGEGDGIKALVTGPSSYIAARSLFPELEGLPETRFDNKAEAFLAGVRNNLVLVRPTRPYYISSGLRARFMNAAQLAVAEAPEPDPGARPLVWFELRTNDRYWTSQADGVPKIIMALRERYPDLGVILAGWSIPDDGVVYPFDQDMIAKDNALADAITSQIADDVPVWNLTGMKTSAKVLWGARCDAFAAVWSVGMMFPLQLGLRPGVIHVNTKFHSYLADPTYTACEDPVPYYLIPADKIRNDESATDLTIQNHEVDWRDIFDALVQHCGLPTPRR